MTTQFVAVEAAQHRSPVVLDSPHSGTVYPADFGYTCAFQNLRKAEDTHVERLFGASPSLGAPLVHALFPRSYIDPNRHLAEIEVGMLADGWTGEVADSPKSAYGMGLVWSKLDNDEPIYAQPIASERVRTRITHCYVPYHAAVQAAVDAAHATFGIDECADFVLGDRDGTTAAPSITQAAAAYLEQCGYSVAINFPYKGVEMVRKHGQPAQGRHALQVEVNRKLYLNEVTREPTDNFAAIQAVLKGLIEQLIAASYQLQGAQPRP
jgi:N-formylglutamate deformylase